MHDPFRPGFLGAARLAQPEASGSIGKRWWLHHIASTRTYLEARYSGDEKEPLVALVELWHAVLEWQNLTKSPMDGVLMAEHTALAKLLIDCATGALSASGCQDTAGEALVENVKAQGKLFSRNPEAFGQLFGRHVEVTGAYVAAYAAGDFGAFKSRYAEALENGHALGLFTDKTFFGR